MLRAGSNDMAGLPLAGVGAPGIAAYRNLHFAGWDLHGEDLNEAVREHAIAHNLDCIRIGQILGSKALTLWIGDGANFPGQQHLARAYERWGARCVFSRAGSRFSSDAGRPPASPRRSTRPSRAPFSRSRRCLARSRSAPLALWS